MCKNNGKISGIGNFISRHGDKFSKKKIITVLILGLVCASILYGFARDEGEPVGKERTRAVRIQEVQPSKSQVKLKYIGLVDSENIVKYSFKTPGKIEGIFVQEGDKIKKGQMLAKLDDDDLRLKYDLAKENYEYTNDLYGKMEKLHSAGAISDDEFDQLRIKKEASKSDFENMRMILEESTIYAEMDGIIFNVASEVGERVGPGQPIIVLSSNGQVVNVGLAQRDVGKIETGSQTLIDIDGQKAKGLVKNIGEFPDPDTRTYNAEIKIIDKKFRVGSIAHVEFSIGQREGIWIPLTSVFSNGQAFVYVIKGERAFKRNIRIMDVNNDKMLVQGLNVGESLAVSGMKNLNDGSKVNIVE